MKKRAFLFITIVVAIFGASLVVVAENFEYLGASTLDLPHNGNVTSKYRKFKYNTPSITYIWKSIEQGSFTPGEARMDVTLRKKNLIGTKIISTQAVVASTSEKNSILDFWKVGSGTYRFEYTTHLDNGNGASMGRFLSDNVGIYSREK